MRAKKKLAAEPTPKGSPFPSQVSEILDAPYNPRRITEKAMQALSKSLDRFGDISGITVNIATGRLVSGHQRLRALRGMYGDGGLTLVRPTSGIDENHSETRGEIITPDGLSYPVRYVLWDEVSEKAANIAANSNLISGDFVKAELGELLFDIKPMFPEFSELRLGELTALDSPLVLPDERPKDDLEEDDGSNAVKVFNEDARFPSSNAWDLPDLLPDMIYSGDVFPLYVYAGANKGDTISEPERTIVPFAKAFKQDVDYDGSFLVFYNHDEVFEAIWSDTTSVIKKILSGKFAASFTPDFSLWRDWPMAVQIYNVYRNRWCGRYMQEAGIKIIPSLSWSDERSWEWCHAGIPKGVHAVGCQIRTTRDDLGQYLCVKGLQNAVGQLEPQNVIIYGGAAYRAQVEDLLPVGPTYHWTTDLHRELERSINKRKALNAAQRKDT